LSSPAGEPGSAALRRVPRLPTHQVIFRSGPFVLTEGCY
jgi:hypothetical protein